MGKIVKYLTPLLLLLCIGCEEKKELQKRIEYPSIYTKGEIIDLKIGRRYFVKYADGGVGVFTCVAFTEKEMIYKYKKRIQHYRGGPMFDIYSYYYTEEWCYHSLPRSCILGEMPDEPE